MAGFWMAFYGISIRMPELWLKKSPNGSLLGADEEALEYLRKIKMGALLHAAVKQPRNAAFHRKIFSLLNWAYHNVELPQAEYKGMPVKMPFERFRNDLIIMAGFREMVVNMRGELRYEAHSIAYDKCNQQKAEEIYSGLLDVVADKLFQGQFSPEELEQLTEEWRSYA